MTTPPEAADTQGPRPPSVWGKLSHHARTRGLLGLGGLAARRLHARWLERRLGIRTCGSIHADQLGSTGRRFGYQPIDYHSFFAAHQHGEYTWLMNEQDEANFQWVREFNRYDLYTKSSTPPDTESLTPYYQALVEQFFPHPVWW